MPQTYPLRSGRKHATPTPSPLRHASNASTSSSEGSADTDNFKATRTSTNSSSNSPQHSKSSPHLRREYASSPPKSPSHGSYAYTSSGISPSRQGRSDRQFLGTLPQAPNGMANQPAAHPSCNQEDAQSDVLSKLASRATLDTVQHTTKRPLSMALSRSESRRIVQRDTKAGIQDDGGLAHPAILEPSEIAQLGRSTTGHLRALSKFAEQGAADDFSIKSPEQVVTGLHGRRRLQRTTAESVQRSTLPGYGGRTWMDQQRQFIQAYEYLCHIGEAKEWIEDVIHKTIPPIVELEEALRDGVTLAEVVQALYPDKSFKIFHNPRLQFRHSDNIAIFFRFLAEVELPDLFRFELVDLYEKKNIPKVIYCIHALSWLLFREGMVDFRIGNLVGQLEFEHHELEQVQKGLDKAGVSMPNFSGMGESFGAVPEPEPVESEQDRIDRLLLVHEASVASLQAQLRGALLRIRLGDTMAGLWEGEDFVVDLQARIRGDWIRQISNYRIERKLFAIRLQSAAKGYLVRAKHRRRTGDCAARTHDVAVVQSLIRGRMARQNAQVTKSRVQRHEEGVRQIQAAIRGASKRWLLGDQMEEIWQAEDTVSHLQSRIRGAIQRMNHHQQQQNSKRAEGIIVHFQAVARAALVRRETTLVLDSLCMHQRTILEVQALSRAVLTRKKLQLVGMKLSKLEPLWIRLQSHCRGSTARRTHSHDRSQLRAQIATVTQLQALSRAVHQRRKIESLQKQIEQHHVPSSQLQAAIRAFLTRDRVSMQLNNLSYSASSIVALQSSIRGLLQRQSIYDQLCETAVHEQQISGLQGLIRAVQQRLRITDILDALEDQDGVIVDLQSLIRGNFVRGKFEAKRRFFEENMKKVIKIQSFVRARQQGEAYKSLTTGKNPPVGAVKNFVHLLNDSDFDFEEEIESEKLRKAVVQRVSANELTEQWIAELDAKIGLLAHNKIARDEFAKLQKHQSGPLGMVGRSPSMRDSFNLKSLNKNSRGKLELYQELFFILQTQPQYLARLFRKVRENGHIDDEHRRLENLILSMFGFAQKRREEYYLLKLLGRTIKEEIDGCATIQEFLRGSFFFGKLFSLYTKVPRDRKFLRQILVPLIKEQIIENEQLDLESDPLQIYRSAINDEELRTGHRSDRNPDISREEAIKDPQTREAFIHHLQDLRDIVDQFMILLEDSVSKAPFGARYVAQQMYQMLCAKFPREDKQALLQVVGNWLWKTYFKPAVIEPEIFGVVDRGLDNMHKRNIAEFAKVVSQVAAGKPFGSENVYLQPLNSYVTEATARLGNIWAQFLDLQDAETHFDIDEFNDLYAKVKPTLYIKMADIFALHQVVSNNVTYMCIAHEDGILREVVNNLGNAKRNEAEMSTGSSEVTLQLSAKLHKLQDPDGDIKALFMETKRCVLYIIRIQTGASLLDIMVKPITEEDDEKWASLVSDELAVGNRKQRAAYSDANVLADLASLTYADIKSIALENILTLEQYGRLTRTNQYQDLLNEIALDIRTKHRRRVQRARELENVRATLHNLEEKAAYLDDKLKTYNDTFEQNLTVLQNKKGKKRFLMPFSKQYNHERELARLGRTPAYGSYKYSAEALHEKGILLEWRGRRNLRDDDVTISSDEVNVFLIEGSSGSMMIPGASATFTWDDLLEAQYSGQARLRFFGSTDSLGGPERSGEAGGAAGELTLDAKLFMQQVSKKFWPE